MKGLMGKILEGKMSSYTYRVPSTPIKFGILIDESDPIIGSQISELRKHPLLNNHAAYLALRPNNTESVFELSYDKKSLPLTKWPVKDDVEAFLSYEFEYFIPLVNRWSNHLQVVAHLARSRMTICQSKHTGLFPWDIAIDMPFEDLTSFLNFASTFVNK